MHTRMIVLAGLALALQLALPPAVHADQAIMSHDRLFELNPGGSVEYTDSIVLSRYGIPTVIFDGASTFADEETVAATITLSAKDGLGRVDLLSASTLTGVTPSHWTADPIDPASSEFTFDPPVSFRYTAPSAEALDCEGRREKVVHTSLRVAATLVGSAGTTASFSAESFPGVVMFDIVCPAETYAEEPTAMVLPTHALPDPTGTIGRSPSPAPADTTELTPPAAPSAMTASPGTSAALVVSADVESAEPGTDGPAMAPAADMTQTAVWLAAVAVIVGVLAASLVRRRRYR